MEKYRDNLKARYIKLTTDDLYMVSRIAERNLRKEETYVRLPSNIKDLIKSNVLIVATTDRVKRADNKADVIIGNLKDAINLVMQDVIAGSELLLEE